MQTRGNVSASSAEASCPQCGAELPAGARFCPSCGARVEAGSTAVIPPPPDETGPVPVTVAEREPHLFGVTPPLALLVLAVAALAVGALLLGLGSLVAGLVLLGVGLVLVVAYLATARDARTRAARERVRAATASLGARSAAAREATRLRHELARLEDERAARLRVLGEAVYAGSDDEAAAARAQVDALDARRADLRRELGLVAARSHEQVERARLEVQPTERVELTLDGPRAED